MTSILLTVVTYLFLRYLWEPRILPVLDTVINYDRKRFKQDLEFLQTYFSKDWTSYRALPNASVYQPVCLRVAKHISQFTNDRMYYYFTDFEVYHDCYGDIQRPKPVEIKGSSEFIKNRLLPVLELILSQT